MNPKHTTNPNATNRRAKIIFYTYIHESAWVQRDIFHVNYKEIKTGTMCLLANLLRQMWPLGMF